MGARHSMPIRSHRRRHEAPVEYQRVLALAVPALAYWPRLVRGFLFNVECDRCQVDLQAMRIFVLACFCSGLEPGDGSLALCGASSLSWWKAPTVTRGSRGLRQAFANPRKDETGPERPNFDGTRSVQRSCGGEHCDCGTCVQ